MGVQSFTTSDVDEARAICNQVFYECRIEPGETSSNPYWFDMTVEAAGPMTLALIGHGSEIHAWVGGPDLTYTVGFPLEDTFPFQFGRETVAANSTTAAVATPTSTFSYRGFRTGTERLFALAIHRDSIETHMGRLLGGDPVGTINLAPSLDLRSGPGAQWRQFTSSLILGLQSPSSLVSNPLMAAQFSEVVMTGLLLAADHQFRDELDAWTRPVPPIAVRRAQAIIEGRAHEALTVSAIAAEVGCSVRALQNGYRTHLNMTPQEHLGIVRLDRAHGMLRAADPRTTSVAAIMTVCGFRHRGRFAADYHKLYGVPPHVTLREV